MSERRSSVIMDATVLWTPGHDNSVTSAEASITPLSEIRQLSGFDLIPLIRGD
jgi:hypothetical protein